ncbi:hypothetical protein GGF46_003751 [Coemansia sp. RSA 552]|nr:hypothetical protein GGF46_003751 [Coemansia sp. RSA 552]
MRGYLAAVLFSAIVRLALGYQGEPCNGHVELCSRPYNNVSFACTHNAYSYPPPLDLFALNQQNPIEQQLADGVRAFMLDVVKPIISNSNDVLDSVHLCHESCLLIDKGKFADTLSVIKKFMDENQREVITLIIENAGEFVPEELAPSFEQSGISAYAYTPLFYPTDARNGYPWPTLGRLIEENQRLITFMDDQANTTKVPYILPQWEYVVETPYANVNPVKEFPCNQDRPHDGIPRDLIVMNHFVYNRMTVGDRNIDMPILCIQVEGGGYNGIDSLHQHWETCKTVWGPDRVPNFITLDYYNVGNGGIFQLVDEINGVNNQ